MKYVYYDEDGKILRSGSSGRDRLIARIAKGERYLMVEDEDYTRDIDITHKVKDKKLKKKDK